jgi:hypothetical protein
MLGLFLAGAALAQAGQTVSDVLIANLHTVPKLRRLVAQDVNAKLGLKGDETLLDKLRPGEMRGGHDPAALADARWAKKEAAQQQALATMVEVKSFIGERFGVERLLQVEALLGPEAMQGVYAAGKRWRPILEPLLRTIPPRDVNDATKEPAWRPA